MQVFCLLVSIAHKIFQILFTNDLPQWVSANVPQSVFIITTTFRRSGDKHVAKISDDGFRMYNNLMSLSVN